MGKINSELALKKVAKYCEDRKDVFNDAASLFKLIGDNEDIGWEECDGVTKHGLAQALSLTASFSDPRGYLRPVSQIRVISNEPGQTKYGIFYGIANVLEKQFPEPGAYTLTWMYINKPKQNFDIEVNIFRKGKIENYEFAARKIDEHPYIELKDNLNK